MFRYVQPIIKLTVIIQPRNVCINAQTLHSHMPIIWPECVCQYVIMWQLQQCRVAMHRIIHECALGSVLIYHMEISSLGTVWDTARMVHMRIQLVIYVSDGARLHSLPIILHGTVWCNAQSHNYCMDSLSIELVSTCVHLQHMQTLIVNSVYISVQDLHMIHLHFKEIVHVCSSAQFHCTGTL